MAAARLGYRTVVLDPADPCPAGQVCNTHIVGAYDDPVALDRLASQSDVVTYEFENIPSDSAARLAASTTLRPNQRSLEVSQDRVGEKEFLRSVQIDTAPFRAVSTVAEIRAAVDAFGGEVIVKTRRFGYDGKGQIRVDGSVADDLVETMGSSSLIAEGVVDFEAEISVIAARSVTGEVRCFEPARNTHRNGILVASQVPAGVQRAVASRAIDHARRLITALDYVGVLGLELFVMRDGTVLANEFAPRVHNSGHWTELVCDVDQFEQHIRAIAGHPLGAAEAVACEMINLIGNDVNRVPELLAEGDWRVHLYGKAEVRSDRKMGHATRRVGKR